MATEADVFHALRAVPEPCSIAMRAPTDICSMGIVQGVEIEGAHVRVTLVLTDPSCVHFGSMQRYIADELHALEGVDEVTVLASTSRLWEPAN